MSFNILSTSFFIVGFRGAVPGLKVGGLEALVAGLKVGTMDRLALGCNSSTDSEGDLEGDGMVLMSGVLPVLPLMLSLSDSRVDTMGAAWDRVMQSIAASRPRTTSGTNRRMGSLYRTGR